MAAVFPAGCNRASREQFPWRLQTGWEIDFEISLPDWPPDRIIGEAVANSPHPPTPTQDVITDAAAGCSLLHFLWAGLASRILSMNESSLTEKSAMGNW